MLFRSAHNWAAGGSGRGTTTNSDQGGTAPGAASLVRVPCADIKFMHAIGYGRNGTVFKARWKDSYVAVKQFDVDKFGHQDYDKEIAAYMMLKDEWGIKVPKPLFLSESFSGAVKFLGLQLGRSPTEQDDLTQWRSLVKSVQCQYGLDFQDTWKEQNSLFITDDSGKERLVMIDLED